MKRNTGAVSAVLLSELKKKYQELISQIHPYLAHCFSPLRLLPAEFEERLRIRASFTFDHMMELGREPAIHCTKFAHPTQCIMSYFAAGDFRLGDAKQLAGLSIDEARWKRDFQTAFYSTVVDTVARCADIHMPQKLPVTDVAWKPPCGGGGGGGNGCSAPLCRAMCRRVRTLLAAWKIAEYNQRFDIMHHAILHLDSHMPILVAWQHITKLPSGECSQELLQRVVDSAEPDLKYAYSHDTTPDLSVVMPMAFGYNNTDVVSNKRNIRRHFPTMTPHNQEIVLKIANMLYKLQPVRCANRETKTVTGECTGMTALCQEVVYKIVVASWLGVYPWCRKVLSIDGRIYVYHAFYSTVNFEEMFEKALSVVLLYMGKEYFWHVLSNMDGMLSVAGSKHDFASYFDYVVKVNELMREKSEAAMREADYKPQNLMAVFSSIKDIAKNLHEQHRSRQTEKTVEYNIHRIIQEFFNHSFTNYNCEVIFPVYGQEVNVNNPFDPLPKHIEDLIRDVVNRFPRHKHVPMDWLVFFDGVSADSVRAMTEAVYMKLPDLKRTISELPPKAYSIFWCFFRNCRERFMYFETIGDLNMYAHHMASMIQFHGIDEGDTITPVSGQILVCPNCKDVKFNCLHSRISRNKSSNGVSKIYTTSRGQMVCGCRQKAVPWQKTSDKGTVVSEKPLPAQTVLTRNRSMAKNIYLHQLKGNCRRTPLVRLCVRGRITRFNDIVYIGCYVCLRAIELENARYQDNKWLCQCCYNMSMKQFSDRISLCQYCNKQLEDSETTSLFLYDDILPPAQRTWRVMGFCKSHGPLEWVRSYTITPCLSLVREGLTKKWGTFDKILNRYIHPLEDAEDQKRHKIE